MEAKTQIPSAFIWRRLHSLTGFWLALFLIEHLLTNSQAALLIGDDGSGFVRAVNFIKSLPYLPAIELTLLGVPIFIHMMWGIAYLHTSKLNSFKTDGTTPSLQEYPRNRAYSWQRITSWVLVIGLIGHIIHMRFVEYPVSAKKGTEHYYMVRVNLDKGLYPLSARLGFELFDKNQVQLKEKELQNHDDESTWWSFVTSLGEIFEKPDSEGKNPKQLIQEQKRQQERDWIEALTANSLANGQGIAVTKDFGTAELLVVRETFKMPIMIVLYTLFVLAACYHGFNGLWTFLITWGITLTKKSQRLMRKLATFLMVLIAFLGLAAIWGTYWINLKY